MKKILLSVIIIITACMLTGCEGSGKVHDKAYLRSAVIDGESYTLSFFSDTDKPLTVTAESLPEARDKAGLSLGREVFTGYTELVILKKADCAAAMESLLKEWKVSPSCLIVSGKGDLRDIDPERTEGEIKLAHKLGSVPECDIITLLSHLLTDRYADTALITPDGCKGKAVFKAE